MQADQKKILRLLRTAQGQIGGIIKMVEEDQYCVDISNQILASEAVLRRANKEIIRAHMLSCVKSAFLEEDTAAQNKKIDEIIEIIDKF